MTLTWMTGIELDYNGLLLLGCYCNLFNKESGLYQPLPKYQKILIIPFAIKCKRFTFITISLGNASHN